jgi:glycosyltransferase involved in cell wall biosynthesis
MNKAVLPLVSVYISTHNRLKKLQRAISSVLKQDYPNIEIIVCDDGSSDGTQEYMQQLVLDTPNIIYKRNASPNGACSARNLGIFSATGEFVTGLDDDDEFHPSRISLLLKHWNSEYAFVCSNHTDQYTSGKSKNYYAGESRIIKPQELLLDNVASNQILTKTEYLTSIGGFDTSVKRLQDWDTWLRLSMRYGQGFRVSDSLYIMHHDDFDENRVSRNMTFSTALDALFQRNKKYYDNEATYYLQSKIRLIKKQFTFLDVIKNCWLKKSIKPVFQYLTQNFKNIDI